VQTLPAVSRGESEASCSREREGGHASHLAASLHLRLGLGHTPELTTCLGWSEPHGTEDPWACVRAPCAHYSRLLLTCALALSSVTVLTDTVLLHSGHLHDDSSIASGAYAKHKSTSGYGLTCYGSTSLQDDVFSSSAFVNWSTSLTLTRFGSFFQVASALLVAAFFYDIFWVFISPLIFKKSVMITVSLKSNHRWLLNTSCRELSIAEMKSRKNSGCSWQR
jgi:hypothetical protein